MCHLSLLESFSLGALEEAGSRLLGLTRFSCRVVEQSFWLEVKSCWLILTLSQLLQAPLDMKLEWLKDVSLRVLSL